MPSTAPTSESRYDSPIPFSSSPSPIFSIQTVGSALQSVDSDRIIAMTSTPLGSPPPYTRPGHVRFSEADPSRVPQVSSSHSLTYRRSASTTLASRAEARRTSDRQYNMPLDIPLTQFLTARHGNMASFLDPYSDDITEYGELDEIEYFDDAYDTALWPGHGLFGTADGIQCPTENAVDLSNLCKIATEKDSSGIEHVVLAFGIDMDDGGSYSSSYGVENILRNDASVYCSGRHGTINVVLRYCGQAKTITNQSCVVSHVVIKSPQYGFTAPCKEGMIFISHYPIKTESTTKFDRFTRADYEKYVTMKGRDHLEDSDPVGWFSAAHWNQDMVAVGNISGKYVLIKLLREESDHENIDLQYVGLIGYTGPCCFASAKIL
ncbi:hypothetical protein CLU79DRAFT_745119 [Phycomyces nitens]|nr:hypothetical protein CLU79DRAFT_745119 [Phycomyces nitens]